MRRKLLRDEGAAATEYLDELHALINGLNERGGDDMAVIRRQVALAVDTLDTATDWLVEQGADAGDVVGSAAAPYLKLFGIVAGGAMMARSAIVALDKLAGDDPDTDRDFYNAKVATARYYAENILPQAAGLLTPIMHGHAMLRAIPDDAL